MRADVLCRVVDNYGDIGVCWRLARRLSQGIGWDVRLWVDDLSRFARIAPAVQQGLRRQIVEGVEIVAWPADDAGADPDAAADATASAMSTAYVSPTASPASTDYEPGDVVIEAFACEPPQALRAAMRSRHPVWINLEYLSAESWVETCHGLPSPQRDGLVRHFFFPGFTPATGGLLREPGLSTQRDSLQRSLAAQDEFLAAIGARDAARRWRDRRARLVTLFCYPHAPWPALHDGLAAHGPAVVLVPEGVAPRLPESDDGRVCVVRIPFLSQEDYDRLLWCGDLNFVRGEDSLVRGIWAARPLVWQIYAQQEQAHLEKLDAWLERYPAPTAAAELTRLWNDEHAPTTTVAAALAGATAPADWTPWRESAVRWAAELSSGADLADNLAEFCADLAKKR
jgi:uncharacterized repeat protein (TIGR03837 family)